MFMEQMPIWCRDIATIILYTMVIFLFNTELTGCCEGIYICISYSLSNIVKPIVWWTPLLTPEQYVTYD